MHVADDAKGKKSHKSLFFLPPFCLVNSLFHSGKDIVFSFAYSTVLPKC